MRTPIQYALTYPNRFENKLDKIDFAKLNQLTFETPDFKKYSCLNLAYYALNKGGNMPCIMNAANEIAVQKFLNEKIKFTEIPKVTENTMQKATFIKNPSLNDLITTDSEAREIAKKNN